MTLHGIEKTYFQSLIYLIDIERSFFSITSNVFKMNVNIGFMVGGNKTFLHELDKAKRGCI